MAPASQGWVMQARSSQPSFRLHGSRHKDTSHYPVKDTWLWKFSRSQNSSFLLIIILFLTQVKENLMECLSLAGMYRQESQPVEQPREKSWLRLPPNWHREQHRDLSTDQDSHAAGKAMPSRPGCREGRFSEHRNDTEQQVRGS